MNALGMIETYGYLAAVEALDSALKAANVTLKDMIKVKGGLVTVLIEGDVGAVRAAVDASEAAAARVGTVVATHVIPRPASGVEAMLGGPDPQSFKGGPPDAPYPGPGDGPEAGADGLEPNPDGPAEDSAETVPELGESAEDSAEAVPKLSESETDSVKFESAAEKKMPEPAVQPEFSEEEPEVKSAASEMEFVTAESAAESAAPDTGEAELEKAKEDVDRKNAEAVPSLDKMRKMTVAKLRSLARELQIPNMTAQEIRFGKKQELIQAITTFTERER